MHIESSEWNNRIFFLIVLYVITTGRAKLHAQRVQVSRVVGVLHVEDLLEEDAVLPARGHESQIAIRRGG